MLGFDVGGTKIEAAVFQWDAPGGTGDFTCFHGGSEKPVRQLSSVRRPTERSQGYDHVVGQMVSAASEALGQAQVDVADLQGLGVGLPGAVDPRSGQMTNGNTLVLVGKPLARDLAAALKVQSEIRLGNDANCFAIAEHFCGAGLSVARESQVSVAEATGVGIILGTGCGGGFVINGKPLLGAQGGAAEVGHTVLYRGGHPCYCGQLGCAEQYLSGSALEAHYSARRYSQVADVKTAREIFEREKSGEPLAVALVKRYRSDLALFLANLTNTLDPHYFVLGGGVSLQPVIYEGLCEEIAAAAFLPELKPVVKKNELGDSAGVVGAALLPLVQ